MSDIEREAFEQRFPVPYGVKWSERRNDYTYEFIQALQEACNYSGKWHAWQAARQAPASGGCGGNPSNGCAHCEPEHGCKAPANGEVEPVAYLMFAEDGRVFGATANETTAFKFAADCRTDVTPLYTHPHAKVPEGENDFGLDARYFHKKLRLILRDISSYTPSEMARALGRLAITASDVTMREAEFQIGDLADQPKYRDTTPTPATTAGAEWVKCPKGWLDEAKRDFWHGDSADHYNLLRDLISANQSQEQ